MRPAQSGAGCPFLIKNNDVEAAFGGVSHEKGMRLCSPILVMSGEAHMSELGMRPGGILKALC